MRDSEDFLVSKESKDVFYKAVLYVCDCKRFHDYDNLFQKEIVRLVHGSISEGRFVQGKAIRQPNLERQTLYV